MELLNNLGLGLSVALSFQNILYCFFGVLLGTLIGVLPGIGPVPTIAMLLPITYALPPISALIMLAGIYYGAQYGGSTTAILVNLPGESSSVVTCIDGYQMARRGKAGKALSIAAIGSFIAGTFATLVVAAFAPPLAEVALKFGPAEYFSLMVLGLIAAVVLASGSLVKAIGMILLGLMLGIVGTDVNSGLQRYTFGLPELSDGIGFVVVAMGLFAFAEIIINLEHRGHREVFTDKVSGLLIKWREFKEALPAILRGTGIGCVLGILPGGGALLSAFAAYTVEKKIAKDASQFGKGDIRGVAAPESANNAGSQTSFIPAAHARHPPERGDGVDGRCDDHPQHPARPAGDDVEPAAVLGADRQHVARESHAGRPEPADDRHLGEAACRFRTGCSTRASSCSAASVFTACRTTSSISTSPCCSACSAGSSSSSNASRRRCCSASSSAR